ncbi:type I secretion C-terminal target domain-containing protein [Fischerella sp. NIES-3754]|uniref:type I secretion C-terminal target domain-containing protein n=1 Tax=Fischerella sp. NIES-3754 TaxID=1752063 RepID=UPI0007208895|nr:type I secretion C-terminal target domain-containing protein [Fischerella sp. NIES-3754]BAU07271.1 cellulose-binding domain-containing protein [Fischerella sp. NIES-3754]
MANTLGVNLHGVSYWSSQLPFLDHFKTASDWMPQNSKTGDKPQGIQLDLDENGWVKSLPKSGSGNYDSVQTLVNLISPAPGVKENYPSGKYVVLYEGEGKLEYGSDAKLVKSASKPGRDVINVTPSSKGISLSLTQTDPKGTGNYLRNIRLVPEAEEKNYQKQVFNPTFVEKTDNYSTLRFMDWMGTNNSKQSDWQNRPTVDSSTYTYFNKGVPVEVMVDLANRTGANPWFNMPHQASDEYMANFAKVVKEKLNPNLKVYVEYSNEVWNGAFGQHQWAQEQGQKLGGDWTDWHSRRTEQMGDIWDKAFGNNSDRVVTVLGAQNGNLQLTDQLVQKVKAYDPNSTVDAIGIAPYLGIFVTPNKQDWTLAESEVESWTKESDGGLNKVFDYLNKTELPKQLDNISKHSEQAKKYGLDLVGYEGGQHLTGLNGSENNQAITDLFIEANRDPRMGQVYKEYLEGWDKLSGDSELVAYSDIVTPTKWGAWGALEHVNQSTSPKWEVIQDFINNGGNSQSATPVTQTASNGSDTLNNGQSQTEVKGYMHDRGVDILMGSSNNDELSGGKGQDALNSLGEDELTGGAGRDRFIYQDVQSQGDTITDFDHNQDAIDLRQIMSGPAYSGSNKFSDYLDLQQVGSDTAVRLDIDGSQKSGGFENLMMLSNVDASSLSPSNFVLS